MVVGLLSANKRAVFLLQFLKIYVCSGFEKMIASIWEHWVQDCSAEHKASMAFENYYRRHLGSTSDFLSSRVPYRQSGVVRRCEDMSVHRLIWREHYIPFQSRTWPRESYELLLPLGKGVIPSLSSMTSCAPLSTNHSAMMAFLLTASASMWSAVWP